MSFLHLPSLPLAAITVKSPAGPAWIFLVLFLVVIIGPPLRSSAPMGLYCGWMLMNCVAMSRSSTPF